MIRICKIKDQEYEMEHTERIHPQGDIYICEYCGIDVKVGSNNDDGITCGRDYYEDDEAQIWRQ